MTVTLTDLFCGAGGSSTGAVQLPGVEVVMAANHAQHAVDTHQANHPGARHDCADISQVVPQRYPRTDILWASPECTNHSGAKGVQRHHGEWNDGLFAPDGTDETAIRSRATMWDVPRFGEAHQYPVIIVENVVESRWWGPKNRPGAIYESWLHTLRHGLGYEHRAVYLNSAYAGALGDPAAQSRDRKYDIFWSEDMPAPDFDKWLRPWASCPQHGWIRALQGWKTTAKCSPLKPWGRYGATRQYLWRCPRTECRNALVEPLTRPASDIIDWSLPATAIKDRTALGMRKLEAATMRRIRAGFETFTRPYLVPVEGRDGKRPMDISVPMRTCSTRNETGLALPPYMVELRGGSSSHRAVTEPLAAVCAGGNHHGTVTPPASGPVTGVEDMRFRMLEPTEYQAAMDFPSDYVLTPEDKRTRVKMLGNAVTPNAARDLIAMVLEPLTGETYEPAPAPIAALDVAA